MGETASSLLEQLGEEVENEAKRLAAWWSKYPVDHEGGGFYGEVSNSDAPKKGSIKGVVQNARILWFLSEYAIEFEDRDIHALAERSFNFIQTRFVDAEHGGVFWAVDSGGMPINRKKHTYGQAFAIYALCSYYKLSNDGAAIELAQQLFNLLETNAFDTRFGGYREAFENDWSIADDFRLSELEPNQPFTMNTHLHVLEAYTALHTVKPCNSLKHSLQRLIDIHLDLIMDVERWTMGLFFEEDWREQSGQVSHGHNIEGSWLIWEASKAIHDISEQGKVREAVLGLVDFSLINGLAERGFLINETDSEGVRDTTSTWWVQAEAIVGFLNAFSLTGGEKYLRAAIGVWSYVQQMHIDQESGEWFWMARGAVEQKDRSYKAGLWKAPYHNGRAMLKASRWVNEHLERQHGPQVLNTAQHSVVR